MAEPVAKKRRLSPPGDSQQNVPGFAKWNLEQKYEQRARKRQNSEKQDKLLVKTAEGKVTANPRMIQQDAPKDGGEDDDSFLASDGEERDSGIADLEIQSVPRPVTIPPKEQVRQAKEELARVAGLLSESPEENIGLLGTLSSLAASENIVVQKLALATQLTVYKDIIPGYRIRPLSTDDLNGKVSKEVKTLRTFEQGLLSGYKEYIHSLTRIISQRSGGSHDQSAIASLSSVAVSCACALLTSVPHFNCRNDLIAILVQRVSGRRLDPDSVKAREAFEKLFREDEDGHSSLEAVKQLTSMMKSKKYALHESIVNTFLHLRLLSEFVHKGSTDAIDKDEPEERTNGKKEKRKREFRTKRERKVLRERKQVEKEMKEADAVVSYEDRDKNQAETLKLVFITYFRILKERVPHLMGAVLEGLAKYSHLINQDFFGDILEALKDLIIDAERLSQTTIEDEDEEDEEQNDRLQRNAVRESLLCSITAFALLQGQQDVVKSANSLQLDLSFFITHLFRTLLPLALNWDIELGAKAAHLADPNGLYVPQSQDTKVNVSTTSVLLLRSLQSILLPPSGTKFVPPVRLAAFVKQLHTLALHLPQRSAIAVLELIKQITKAHGLKVAALWNTEERRGDGTFDPLSQGVESSNPFASTIWEGELLRLHFDPKISDAVVTCEKNLRPVRHT